MVKNLFKKNDKNIIFRRKVIKINLELNILSE